MSTNQTQLKELPYSVHVATDNVMEVTPTTFPNITREQIEDETVRFFHMGRCKRIFGVRGGVNDVITVFKRNGKTKTWKTRPTHFHVPIQRGCYNKQSLNHENVGHFHLAKECPLKDVPATREGIVVEVTEMLEDVTGKLKQKVWNNLVEKAEVDMGMIPNSERGQSPEEETQSIKVEVSVPASVFFIVTVPKDAGEDEIRAEAMKILTDHIDFDFSNRLLAGIKWDVDKYGGEVHVDDGSELPDPNQIISIHERIVPDDGFTCSKCLRVQPHGVLPSYIEAEKPLCNKCYDEGMDILSNLNSVLPDDGYADGGEPYTKEELAIINEESKPTEEKWRVDVQGVGENVWSANGLEYPDTFKAAAYAKDLYSRWTGMAAWRIVPTSTPRQERVLGEHKGMIVDAKGNISKP